MRAEQELKASRKEIEDLKAVLDEHGIVAITDEQGKITNVNNRPPFAVGRIINTQRL